MKLINETLCVVLLELFYLLDYLSFFADQGFAKARCYAGCCYGNSSDAEWVA